MSTSKLKKKNYWTETFRQMNNGKMGEAKYINVGHRSPVKIDQCKLNILKIKNRPEIKKMVAQLVLTRLAPWYSLYDQAPL
ncbi:Uncharacterized protein APZ42_014217 [Daphnia magna]|uniref:Uncharacterized protein n=1 Tax=Daphnia magna TaxID=35525 RepID=A0A162Q274_9CRUS|nr:Uncharacterized protein APZ42_014217 [Daphnia magna]